jgi:hypothetical protein
MVYTIVRKIHLYSGLSLLGFVLMYFVTGYILTHHSWFPSEQAEPVEETYDFIYPADKSLAEVSVHIQGTYGLRGKRAVPKTNRDSTLTFRYFHPGTSFEAIVSPKDQKLVIKTQAQNFRQIAVAFHRIHNYGGGWIYSLYAFMMDLTSLSMIVFALTGIYLWLQLVKYKWLGYGVLFLSLGYALSVVWILMR